MSKFFRGVLIVVLLLGTLSQFLPGLFAAESIPSAAGYVSGYLTIFGLLSYVIWTYGDDDTSVSEARDSETDGM